VKTPDFVKDAYRWMRSKANRRTSRIASASKIARLTILRRSNGSLPAQSTPVIIPAPNAHTNAAELLGEGGSSFNLFGDPVVFLTLSRARILALASSIGPPQDRSMGSKYEYNTKHKVSRN
jgi:hypothetical protein